MSFGDILRTRRLKGLYNSVISKTIEVFFTKIAIKTKPKHILTLFLAGMLLLTVTSISRGPSNNGFKIFQELDGEQ